MVRVSTGSSNGCRQTGCLRALAPPQVRMHHFADDRPGPDDRHLHHDVVKRGGLHSRQAGHLRAALHLKQSHRVGLLQRLVDRRIVRGQMRQVHLFVVMIANQR